MALKVLPDAVAGDPERLARFTREAQTLASLRQEYLPVSERNPTVRLSLAPDGVSVTYSTARFTSNLCLAEGLDAVTPR